MKRIGTLFLTLVMMMTLTLPAWAAGAVTPTAPAWVKDSSEYLTFPGDSVYESANWNNILTLRADAAAGNVKPSDSSTPIYTLWNSGEKLGSSAGLRFELGLIGMKYAENSTNHRQASGARRYFSLAQSSYLDGGGSKTDASYYLMELWYLRARLLECSPSTNQTFSGLGLENFLKESGYTMEQFKSYPGLSVITAEEWSKIDLRTAEEKKKAEAAKSKVTVLLDGKRVDTEGLAVVKNGRTMIPIRCLAEQLGADVSYDTKLKAARIVRAGVEIIMPIGSKTATVDGKPVAMDIAPYIESGRTMIPARYVSEWFGQSIEWIADTRSASVTENKTLAGDTNLENWALAMGSYLNWARTAQINVFGGRVRGTALSLDVIHLTSRIDKPSAYPYEEARYILSTSWEITDRESLISTVCSMTDHGHNDDFMNDVAFISSLSSSEYQSVLNQATGMDTYMFPFTKQLGQKWGDKGILAWDLFRMSNLVQWGYLAGYITYPEALALLKPAAQLLQNTFSSWSEACENYLDGYNWWARNDVLGKSVWTVTRGPAVKNLLNQHPEIFDNTLFQKPIQSVKNITAEQLLASVK